MDRDTEVKLMAAKYLRGVPQLSDRLAFLAAHPKRMTRRDERELDRRIAEIKAKIRRARETEVGPT